MSESKNTGLHLVGGGKLHRRGRGQAVPPPPKALPPELVQKALDDLLQCELADFAGHLETARTIWRRHPELVEARGFPEHLRAAFVARNGEEPNDDCDLAGVPYVTAEVRDRERPHAEDIARGWAARGRGPRSAS